jgi:hypothetical protein
VYEVWDNETSSLIDWEESEEDAKSLISDLVYANHGTDKDTFTIRPSLQEQFDADPKPLRLADFRPYPPIV